MLQLENSAAVLDTGRTESLVEAFPNEDRSFDFSAYSSGEVCIFLSVLSPATTLPAQQEVARALRQMGAKILAGRTVFSLELTPFEREAVRRLAEMFVEVVIDGRYKGFQLIAAPREADGEVEVCVSQGFCDFVLGRWDRWSTGQPDFSAAMTTEPASQPWSWTCEEAFAVEQADVPSPAPEARRSYGSIGSNRSNDGSNDGSKGEGFRPLRRLAGLLSPERGARSDPAAAVA